MCTHVSYLPHDHRSGTHSCDADRWCFVLHTPCRHPPVALIPRWSHSQVSVREAWIYTNIRLAKVVSLLWQHVDRTLGEQPSTFLYLQQATLIFSPLFNSAPPLCPFIWFSLSFSPSHKHLLSEKNCSLKASQEEDWLKSCFCKRHNAKAKNTVDQPGGFIVYWEPCCLRNYSGFFSGTSSPSLQNKPIKGEVLRQDSNNLGNI